MLGLLRRCLLRGRVGRRLGLLRGEVLLRLLQVMTGAASLSGSIPPSASAELRYVAASACCSILACAVPQRYHASPCVLSSSVPAITALSACSYSSS